VIKLQYHRTDKEIRVNPHHSLVEINTRARFCNVGDVFIFAKQCKWVYYTYNFFFRKDHSIVDWLSVMKTKPTVRVQVFQDGNNKVNTGDDIFQLDELIDPHRVTMSTILK